MASSIKLTQKMLNTWLEAAWRDGFTKGVDGEDSIPDFSTLDPRGPEDGKKLSPSEAQVAEYNPCKCGARMFREGFGVQCSRKPFGDGLLCKTHQKVIDEQPSEFDLPFGWFNKERPSHHLDQKQHGKSIAWSDTKKVSKSSTKKRATAKEMRDQLTEMGISIDGLKGKTLTLKYNEVMDSQQKPDENSQSSEEQHHESPSVPQDTHTLRGQNQITLETEESDSEDSAAGTGLQMETVEQSVEQPVDQPVEQSVDQPVEQSVEQSVEATEEVNTNSDTQHSGPSTTAEFKKLFQELGISADGLRGKKAFKDRYQEYLKEQEAGDETEDMSDDELDNDTSNFVEVDFDGVEYLEDEQTANIYNVSHELVGKWNEDGDDIIWASDKFKIAHDTLKD